MPDVLVDTNVFSYVLKGDTRASLYAPHMNGKRLHLCFATVAELYQWSIAHAWGQQRIAKLLVAIGSYNLIGYDDSLAWDWARVMSIKGLPMAPGDAWIAAAALRHGFPLVTHNRKHFEHIPGLTVISEA